MPHTLDIEKITKERYDYPNYGMQSFGWLSGISGIRKTISQPDYFDRKCEVITVKREADIKIEVEDYKVELPGRFDQLANEIEDSKYLMELEEDWDGEGGIPITFETWKKSIAFLTDYAMFLYDNQQYFVIDPPQINPGPDASIDLLWRNDKYRLLVNIPGNTDQQIEYYGDNNCGENSIKGKLKMGSVQEFFALWLKNMRK